jgi:hypothetical protein
VITRDGAPGIPPDLCVVVSVQINKTGRNNLASRVDDLGTRAVRPAANLRDLAVLDPEVAFESRHSRAIDDGAPGDVNVEFVFAHDDPLVC